MHTAYSLEAKGERLCHVQKSAHCTAFQKITKIINNSVVHMFVAVWCVCVCVWNIIILTEIILMNIIVIRLKCVRHNATTKLLCEIITCFLVSDTYTLSHTQTHSRFTQTAPPTFLLMDVKFLIFSSYINLNMRFIVLHCPFHCHAFTSNVSRTTEKQQVLTFISIMWRLWVSFF